MPKNLYSLHLNPKDDLLSWLTYNKMLTARLYAISKDTKLTVLQSNIRHTAWWDRYTLGIKDNTIYNREIIISAHSAPCWYARTIIPINTYTEHAKLFARLENELLGDLIFGNNGIKRNYLKYYCIDEKNIEYHWLPQSVSNYSNNLWLRLSKFTVLQDSFYLVEIFLPEMEKYI